MGVTRLKRKARKKSSRTHVRRQKMKSLNFKPVMKNVDIEKIKESFKKGTGKKKPSETKSEVEG